HHLSSTSCLSFCFFTDPATTEISTLSLHDALPISGGGWTPSSPSPVSWRAIRPATRRARCASSTRGRSGASPRNGYVKRSPRSSDRKSTRLNSSHVKISYAVFCLKKKKKKTERVE